MKLGTVMTVMSQISTPPPLANHSQWLGESGSLSVCFIPMAPPVYVEASLNTPEGVRATVN